MAKLVAHRENPIPCLGSDMPETVQAVFEKMVAKKIRRPLSDDEPKSSPRWKNARTL